MCGEKSPLFIIKKVLSYIIIKYTDFNVDIYQMNHLLLVDTFSKGYYFILVDSDTTTDLSAVYIESIMLKVLQMPLLLKLALNVNANK